MKTAKEIAIEIANKSGMPYTWEGVLTALENREPLPYPISDEKPEVDIDSDSQRKIDWISEALGVQPMLIRVGNKYQTSEGLYTIGRIDLEVISVADERHEYYKGYSLSGKLLFEFRRGAVNVGYK